MEHKSTIADQPSFSVIIPTFNRPERLTLCLSALVDMQYPRDRFEVIVVDDGSPKPLAPVVTSFEDQINVRLIVQSNSGPASARNRGAKEATGDFFAFTDDDCQPTSNWLSTLASQFSHTPDAMIGGHTVNALSKNLCSEASQRLIDYLYEYFNTEFSEASFFTSNNLAVSRHRFHQIGGFDTAFKQAAAEDREMGRRWFSEGYPFIYLRKAIVQHQHALTLRSFFRQHFNYGCGAFHYHQMHAKHHNSQIKFEPKNFYLNLLRYPFSCGLKSAFSLSLLIVVSQAANALGFLKEAFKFRIKRADRRSA